MQQNLAQLEEELEYLKDQLSAAEEERDRALIDLRWARKEAEEANSRLQEAFTPRKIPEIYTELNTVKKLLTNANQELRAKEDEIAALRTEAERARRVELEIAERDAVIVKLRDELAELRDSEPGLEKRRVRELEEELAGRKEAESKVLESLMSVSRELEETKISLEESKRETGSIKEKFERQNWNKEIPTPYSGRNCFRDGGSAKENLCSELQSPKESLARAQDGEKQALLKAQGLLGEIRKLRAELKSANEAEENGKKAMDDLAMALKEVATELGEVKMKHELATAELDHWRAKAEGVRAKSRGSEEKYRNLLEEARKEAEKYKNTAERLRHEAEETLLAWNDKETMFVGCIRRAEEEKTLAQQENIRLLESIRTGDNMVRSAKDENVKLRDILKQAINEANVAKEAANIAKAENSQLKDTMSERDDALNFLSREIEILRANEMAAMENIRELKRLVAEATPPSPQSEDRGSTTRRSFRKQGSMESSGRKLGKAFSFNLKELRIHTKHNRDMDNDDDTSCNTNSSGKSRESSRRGCGGGSEEEEEVVERADDDPLKGSIFDAVDSPGPVARHHRKRSSSTFTSDGEGVINPDELDHLEAAHFDDLENGRFSSRRRSRLLRRFGDLLVRRRGSGEIKHR